MRFIIFSHDSLIIVIKHLNQLRDYLGLFIKFRLIPALRLTRMIWKNLRLDQDTVYFVEQPLHMRFAANI